MRTKFRWHANFGNDLSHYIFNSIQFNLFSIKTTNTFKKNTQDGGDTAKSKQPEGCFTPFTIKKQQQKSKHNTKASKASNKHVNFNIRKTCMHNFCGCNFKKQLLQFYVWLKWKVNCYQKINSDDFRTLEIPSLLNLEQILVETWWILSSAKWYQIYNSNPNTFGGPPAMLEGPLGFHLSRCLYVWNYWRTFLVNIKR